MTYQDKLIKFMWKKNDILKEAGYDFGYMKLEIEKSMKKWDEEECKEIFDELELEIYEFQECGLVAETCPFCIKHTSKCDNCEYGKINGGCGRENSVYEKYENIEFIINIILSNTVYKKILRELEK